MRIASFFTVLVALVASAGPAQAEMIYGVTDATTSTLVSFDSGTPGVLTTVGTVTGIVAGQTLRGIDFRASNGLLYGLSSLGTAAQLYTINLGTGAATAVGAGFTLAGNTSTRVSLDFNPVVDALRVVTGTGQSYRVNATTGALTAQDTSVSANTLISGIAYTNNVAGATQTTLYAYDFLTDDISTIGGVNGIPSPNGGELFRVGNSGVISFSGALGFDISGTTGVAYLSLDDFDSPNANSESYTVNLATGAATFAGQFSTPLLDISVAPARTPSPSRRRWPWSSVASASSARSPTAAARLEIGLHRRRIAGDPEPRR